MKTRRFTTRAGVPLDFTVLGFGGAPLGNLYRAIPEAEAERTLEAAWAAGLRYFDTAPQYGYGLSELRLGRPLRGRPRDSYLLSSKVGRLLEPCAAGEEQAGNFVDTPHARIVYDYSYDGVLRSWEDSRRRLGIECLDLLYIHDVDAFTHGSRAASDRRVEEVMAGGYRALVELREAGAVAAIGAGVNEWQVCETLARRGDFDLFLLAGRYTLLEQEALESFLPLCLERGIGVVVGGPYNSGILATGPVPGARYDYAPAPPQVVERVRAIEAVCQRHGVALATAALHFPLAHPAVVSVIPGGQTVAEVARNVATLGQPVPAELWRELRHEGLLRADAPVPDGGP
ncbi:D-threo-aldose 1-dehydrogenase [Tistlia consotensis]|uniref:D-threo-aldose 1-dehydrogenase n=1 Tax=Tistlia consotensis USBA 355 TaxID=560819 RepID=A0A1Y6BWZ1_9PROT|nr:aldo/keto reductase [Tistlia consotensis]SMF29471.1 D-threo-aldose 1-dehydrogenase [Tistlia consotensis USBA 355]SNR91282.1 D-threo-aldose 1-dehydrogenase [Tistlia consotensis]